MLSTIKVGATPLTVEEYKDGAVGVVITSAIHQEIRDAVQKSMVTYGIDLNIIANLKDSAGVLALLYLLDYLEEHVKCHIGLVIPYFPNARQDRLTTDGVDTKTLTVKSLASLLNKYTNVSRVLVTDAHSDVTPALVSKCYNMTQADVVKRLVDNFKVSFDVLVAPDLGAVKKAKETAKLLDKPLAIATKTRNPITNELTEISLLNTDVKDKVVLITDDILDGGRTFIGVAKALKEAGASKVILAVTHGIFSYGYKPLLDSQIDSVLTYYCWLPKETVESSIEFVKTMYYF